MLSGHTAGCILDLEKTVLFDNCAFSGAAPTGSTDGCRVRFAAPQSESLRGDWGCRLRVQAKDNQLPDLRWMRLVVNSYMASCFDQDQAVSLHGLSNGQARSVPVFTVGTTPSHNTSDMCSAKHTRSW